MDGMASKCLASQASEIGVFLYARSCVSVCVRVFACMRRTLPGVVTLWPSRRIMTAVRFPQIETLIAVCMKLDGDCL